MKKIAITGGIGSGKSSVCEILKKHGYCVWDADVFARDVLFLPEVADSVKLLFGKNVFLEKGQLDRQLVRKRVFDDASLKEKLENILHPAIAQLFAKKVVELECLSPTAWIFYEAALILEKNKKQHFDACVVVTAHKDMRANRILKSRNVGQDEFEKMMNAQMSDEEKKAQADYVIENHGDLEDLEVQTQQALYFLYKKFRDKKPTPPQ